MATCDVNLVNSALGIRQTGPRTVIIPADPIIWSEETSYEYLTLVASTDYGQGYISKRDVPAGTPLTDTEYWIPVAQFNAQLAEIQRNIQNINTAINGKAPTAHASSAQTYGVGTSSLYGHLKITDTPSDSPATSGVAASPKMVNDVINKLNSRVYQKKLALFGDSWCDTTDEGVDVRIPQTLQDDLGVTVQNYAKSGASFGSSGLNFQSQIQDFLSTSPNPDEYSAVVLVGGINDVTDSMTWPNLQTAVVNTFSLLESFVEAGVPVYFMPDIKYNHNWLQYVCWTSAKMVLMSHGIITVPMIGWFEKGMFISDQGLHLTGYYNAMCGHMIASVLRGNPVTLETYTQTFTEQGITGSINVQLGYDGGIATIGVNANSTATTADFTVNLDSVPVLGKFNAEIVGTFGAGTCSVSCEDNKTLKVKAAGLQNGLGYVSFAFPYIRY